MNRNDIINYTGAENWQMINDSFGGKAYQEILAELNYMFPQDENDDLAKAIYNEVGK